MTSRSKNAVRGYETEIEKSREESNWKKAVELAQQLKARSPQHESLAHFLIGEGKLEAHLEEWPPSKENIERAQRELSEARGYLTLATDEAGKRAGVALDAHLLLGKLNYACGAYDDALKNYKLAELNTLTEKELPVRSLRIVAESYAIKGLCLELNTVPGSTSRYKQAERENEMIRSFELSSDLTLLYLQRTGANAHAGPTLETALQRVPILHIRAGRLQNAIDRYREMLNAVESTSTQALRLTLTRQLAEVLMRGVTGQVYKAPEKLAVVPATGTLSRRRDDHVADGPWKPKRYAAINQFVPRNEYEEVVLLLLVGEAMAVRDAVLSQSAEFEAARAHALRNAIAVTDLLALAATRWGQLCLVLESLERAMKFSFNCAHIWRQRALATAAAAPARAVPPAAPAHVAPASPAWSAGVRAAGVARRAATLVPHDTPLRLVAASTCYRMGWIEEGIEMSEEALAIEDARGGRMLARCCLYAGQGYQMKAQKTNARIDKEAANDTSLKLLLRAVSLDDNDHLAFYYLALQYMHLGMLNEAMDATRSCLAARAECGGGLRLAVALWSCACAGSRGARALAAARLARDHYPHADWPLAALAQLQLTWETPEEALATGKELLSLVNSSESELEPEHNGYAELDAMSDSVHDDTQSNRDAASIRAESAGVYRIERALSEGASSLSTARPRVPGADSRAQAWLLLAQLCLRLGRVSAAAGCVSEAATLTPFSHLVLYTRGLVHAASSEWDEARQCFQNALAIHPTHLDSMVQLGAAYYNLGWLGLAEKALREAAALEPGRADTWRRLALVLCAAAEPLAAADAAAAALALHPHEPKL
nr:tetratricopeptide repeat protein 7B isoform X1 [Helicoverpa armigera]XP_049703469.1 tetratricopeptide repeat protein 7B isoform X2 [Helicoverpa armigera]XP_049703470.1 tetratricopeptide repeat protein 7B isoform X3 [Helicoverpa armigera]XP_049703471.1 tetratricopeptide repeat protein 7B isoform X4 [Helicoverpa armigera]XP_049703472.1 tetratricopeptide repeat protein 7B isoform X5 [Helicoverpa armigera]